MNMITRTTGTNQGPDETPHTKMSRFLTRRRQTKPGVAGLALVLLSTLAAIGLSTQPASALTWSQSGYVGSVLNVRADVGAIAGFGSGVLSSGSTIASKASAYANYDQYICANTRLFVLSSVNGLQKWTVANSYRQCGWASGAIKNV